MAVRRSLALLSAVALALVSCGGNGKSSEAVPDNQIPAECSLPPYTVHAVRDGGLAAGSPTFEVIGAAAVPVPLVPDKDQTLTVEQASEMGRTTDLVGYSLLFGDEPFGVDDVGLFSGYTPEAAGKSRGSISVYPHTTTPLAVGDVLTEQPMDALGMFTTLKNVSIDFKATPDELMGYITAVEGSVTILGLTDEAICLDVDLSWGASDIDSGATGVLTIRGIFTAPLAERTLPFS